MVIGGAMLYASMLPRADRLYLTYVKADFDGNAWFPAWPAEQWQEVVRESHAADERNANPYAFAELGRGVQGIITTQENPRGRTSREKLGPTKPAANLAPARR